MECPRCKENRKWKDGFVRGQQRYQCRSCKFRYTVEKRSNVKSLEQRRLALEMYLEGLGFRAIGRILKISYGTVYNWIKTWGSQVSLPINSQGVEMMEIDEMHSYVQSKKLLLDMDCC